MSHTKRTAIEAAICVALALVMIVMDARAQEPAEVTNYTSDFTVEYELTQAQVKKLEAKAIEIIRRKGTVTGEQVTLAEARAIVRPNGVTNVQLCFEYVSTDRLFRITQATVRGVQIQRLQPKAVQDHPQEAKP